jgi:hypothetical protein
VRPEPDKFMKQSGKSWEAPTHRIGFTDRDAPQAPIGLAITGGSGRSSGEPAEAPRLLRLVACPSPFGHRQRGASVWRRRAAAHAIVADGPSKKPRRCTVGAFPLINNTPAATLGRVKAPDAESAIRKAIEEPAQAAGYAVASLTTGPNPP